MARSKLFRNNLSGLENQARELKVHLFNSIVRGSQINTSDIQSFQSFVNNLLQEWSAVASETMGTLRSIPKDITLDRRLYNIEYDYMRPFIHSQHDYASMLQFAQGMLSGIEEGKFKTNDSFEHFFDHTVILAFNNQATSLDELVDSVLSGETLRTSVSEVDGTDLQMFLKLRHGNDLFNSRDRVELYQALSATLSYVAYNPSFKSKVSESNKPQFISFINSLVEYIKYTIVAYMSRIMIISEYVLAFSVLVKNDVPEQFDESTTYVLNTMLRNVDSGAPSEVEFDNISTIAPKDPSSILQSPGNEIVFDETYLGKYIGRFSSAMTKLGVPMRLGPEPFDPSKSKIFASIKDNPLFGLTHHRQVRDEIPDTQSRFNDHSMRLFYTLKETLHNRYVGFNGTTTARNEIWEVFRNYKFGSTSGELKESLKEVFYLVKYAYDLLHMNMSIRSTLEHEHMTQSQPLGFRSIMSGASKFLHDLYREYMLIISMKAAWLERRISELNGDTLTSMFNIDSTFKNSDNRLNTDPHDFMEVIISNKSRTPIDDNEMNSMIVPKMEYHLMYDEYLRTLPLFEDNQYLSESLGDSLSELYKKIVAFIQKYWEKFKAFIQGQQFSSAKKWVEENKSKLSGLSFPEGPPMNILPYRDNISLPGGLSSLREGLKNFNPDNQNVREFIESLYPEGMAEWFSGDEKSAKTKYMNAVLFNVAEGTSEDVKQVPLNRSDIPNKMNVWIATTTAFDPSQLESINSEIKGAVDAINQKIKEKINSDVDDATKARFNEMTQGINRAITRLWLPVTVYIMRAMTDQYKYIKEAYGLAGKPEPAEQSSGTTDNL